MHTESNPNPARILRVPAVTTRTSLSRSSIYRMEAEGTFPRRIKIGPNATGWLESDVEQWIADRVTASKAAA